MYNVWYLLFVWKSDRTYGAEIEKMISIIGHFGPLILKGLQKGPGALKWATSGNTDLGSHLNHLPLRFQNCQWVCAATSVITHSLPSDNTPIRF